MTCKSTGISVVVPSLKGETGKLEEALARQTWPPDEIRVVKGVRPNGRARNQGARQARGQVLAFIDDDAMPGAPDLLERLVRPLLEDGTIGVTGAARVLPPGASWFQLRVAKEIPRTVNTIPQEPLETNPPLTGYGHSLITTTCAALPRAVYLAAGGFQESLTSGVDTDFFYRVRRLGYRFVMVPGAYVEHPAPADLLALLRKFHWYGQGYGQEAHRNPARSIGPRLPTRFHRLAFLLLSALWFAPNCFLLYSPGYPRLEIGFRPLKALSTLAVACGYAQGWRDAAPPLNPSPSSHES